MNQLKRIISLIFGLFLYALGIVMTLKANIGYAPWDVFHAGVVHVTALSFGNVSIVVGLVIILITKMMGEKIGLGTVLNMLLIGIFIDLLLTISLPEVEHWLLGLLIQIAGLALIALGSYYYIRAGLGTGPRDGLMVAINRQTGLSIGLSRGLIELSAAIIGWLLGGLLGIGTIISAFLIGILVEYVFKLYDFKAADVEHQSLAEILNEWFN